MPQRIAGSARPRRRRTAVLTVALAALVVMPTALVAHQILRSTAPADGDSVDSVPAEIRLTFSEPVRLEFTELAAIGPQGALAMGDLRRSADNPRVLVGPVEGGWHPGTFTVRWSTVGADGHRTGGTFSFTVQDGATGLPEPEPEPDPADHADEPAPPVATHDPELFPHAPGFGPDSAPYVAVRALLFLALIIMLGAVALRLVVIPVTAQRWPEDASAVRPRLDHGAAGLGLGAAVALLVAAMARLLAQTASLFGPSDALDPERIMVTLGFMPWGAAWLIQVAAALLGIIGFAIARRGRSVGWAIATIAAVAAAVTPALSGHAVASPRLAWLAVPTDTIHVLAAGGWIGSLLALIAIGIPAALRLEPHRRGTAAAALVHGFSPTALAFTGTLITTGVLSAWLHLGEITALWTTTYGRTLLLKVGVFSAVALVGAYNLFRVRPALGEVEGARRLRRSGTLELVLALAVIVITAVLVAVPPPAR